MTIQTTAAGGEKHDNKCTLILLLWAQHLLSCFLRGNAAPSILWHRSDFIALLSFNLAAFISFACIIALGSILLPSSAGPVLCPLAACKGHSVSPPTHQLTLSLRLKPSATPPHLYSLKAGTGIVWEVYDSKWDTKNEWHKCKMAKIDWQKTSSFCRRNLQYIGEQWSSILTSVFLLAHILIGIKTPGFSSAEVNRPVIDEVRGVSTMTLAAAAAKLFKRC